MSQPRDARGRFTSGPQGEFDAALDESAERLRDMNRETAGASRGLAGLFGGVAQRAGGGVGSVGIGAGLGAVFGGAAGLARGAGIAAGVSAGSEALRSFGRAGDPVQSFYGHLIQLFDPGGAHKPAQTAGAATLGVLGQAAASGAAISREDVSREFTFQEARARRVQQVEHLVEEEVHSRVRGRYNEAAADVLLEILDVLKGIRDLNPFGGGGSR